MINLNYAIYFQIRFCLKTFNCNLGRLNVFDSIDRFEEIQLVVSTHLIGVLPNCEQFAPNFQ